MTKRGDDLGVILGLPYFFRRLLMSQPLFFRHIQLPQPLSALKTSKPRHRFSYTPQSHLKTSFRPKSSSESQEKKLNRCRMISLGFRKLEIVFFPDIWSSIINTASVVVSVSLLTVHVFGNEKLPFKCHSTVSGWCISFYSMVGMIHISFRVTKYAGKWRNEK